MGHSGCDPVVDRPAGRARHDAVSRAAPSGRAAGAGDILLRLAHPRFRGAGDRAARRPIPADRHCRQPDRAVDRDPGVGVAAARPAVGAGGGGHRLDHRRVGHYGPVVADHDGTRQSGDYRRHPATIGPARRQAVLVVVILLWAALGLARVIDTKLQNSAALSPSVQVLTGNLVRIALISVALLIGLNAVGIDLTAFAVFSGAVGVGIGFGLQKIVSNFVSGIILLLERSIKPGDVIEVGSTFGSVTYLGARYASVRGRDGKEYLIPNENLITNQVVNWSYSSLLVRLDVPFGVAYDSDLHAVRELAVEVAKRTRRVLASPTPVCHLTQFGDSAVNLLLRFWIEDPANGVTNIKGAVLLVYGTHSTSTVSRYPSRSGMSGFVTCRRRLRVTRCRTGNNR